MATKIEIWNNAMKKRKDAEAWNDLPKGRKYHNTQFNISIQHGTYPKLVRAGQQTEGGKNYWETNPEFGKAMLEYLVNDWDKHYPNIIKILLEDESKALTDCQEHITHMQEIINAAKTEEPVK